MLVIFVIFVSICLSIEYNPRTVYALLNQFKFYLHTGSFQLGQALVCLCLPDCLPTSGFNSNTIGLEAFCPTILFDQLYYHIN